MKLYLLHLNFYRNNPDNPLMNIHINSDDNPQVGPTLRGQTKRPLMGCS